MKYQIDDVIKYNDGEYLILNIINYKDNTYLYLINNDEFKNDVSIVKTVYNNGKITYEHIENDEEFDYVINKIFLNFKDDILSLISND